MQIEEDHRTQRIGWLRAGVLGANDGIVSVASILVGVAAANVSRSSIVAAGLAGLVGGAMSMAAGEYVSVSSQADTEKADLAKERRELRDDPSGELEELAGIYVDRGLDYSLAKQVAEQLMSRDALAAHARDELGISEALTARPIQAALTSALTFTVGAALPLLVALFAAKSLIVPLVAGSSLLSLALLGGVAAKTGDALVGVSVIRVAFWGALAMAVTAGVGLLFGAAT
jgi:VIT1/CCC1 family predicted Fe2+/Mn2+ transporter